MEVGSCKTWKFVGGGDSKFIYIYYVNFSVFVYLPMYT